MDSWIDELETWGIVPLMQWKMDGPEQLMPCKTDGPEHFLLMKLMDLWFMHWNTDSLAQLMPRKIDGLKQLMICNIDGLEHFCSCNWWIYESMLLGIMAIFYSEHLGSKVLIIWTLLDNYDGHLNFWISESQSATDMNPWISKSQSAEDMNPCPIG